MIIQTETENGKKYSELADHFYRNENSNLVQNSVNNSRYFKGMAEHFYDISLDSSGNNDSCSIIRDRSKEGKRLDDLLDIVEPFSVENFNRELLNYENVREKIRRDSFKSSLFNSLYVGANAGVFGSFAFAYQGIWEGLIAGVAFTVGCVYSGIETRKSMEKDEESPQSKEFDKFKKSLSLADDFSNKYLDYRQLNHPSNYEAKDLKGGKK